MSTYFQRHAQLWLLAGCIGIFTIAWASPVTYAPSDPKYTLLTSQALLQQHTVRLDAYVTRDLRPDAHQLQLRNGHIYYVYPIGSSLAATPFVWLANLAGKDLSDDQTDRDLQKFIASLCLAAIFLVLYGIARHFLNEGYSLLTAAGFALGTSIASTVGAALWSFDFEVLFLFCAVLAVLRAGPTPSWSASLGIGSLLAFACLCRPTAVLGALALLAFLAARHRPAALKTALALGVWCAVYLLFSWREFGSVVPGYVTVQADAFHARQFWLPLYGTTFGPGRGLFVYSPPLLFTLVAAVATRAWRRNVLAWMCIAWAAGGVLMLASFDVWWGGYSFGSRLFTDGLVPMFIVTCTVLVPVAVDAQRVRRRLFTSLFAVLIVGGVFINTFQGLYNEHAFRWNGEIDVNSHVDVLLDWRYPQFLVSPRQLVARNAAYAETQRQRILPGLPAARLAADTAPSVDSVTKYAVLAFDAGEYCDAARGAAILKEHWNTSTDKVDLTRALAGCAAVRPGIKGDNLFVNGDFTQGANGLEGWSVHAEADAETYVQTRDDEHVWHARFRQGNWAVIFQALELKPDTTYLWEATLRSLPPVIALYWQTDTGRLFAQSRRYINWTPIAYAFTTPHWDGRPFQANFHPILMKEAGDAWLKNLRLSELKGNLAALDAAK